MARAELLCGANFHHREDPVVRRVCGLKQISGGRGGRHQRFETMMWGGATTRPQLQESIRQLWKVDEVPQTPAENLLVQKMDLQRHLSVSREQEIASNLAFLSATTDDSLRVMAVCVEERPDVRGATIRIASNTGDLTAVTSGMRRLANVLEQAARRGQYLPERDVKLD